MCLLNWRTNRRRYTETRNFLSPPSVSVVPSTGDDGEITVYPPDDAVAPVRAFWTSSVPVTTSSDGMRVYGLPPGSYSFHVVDAKGYTSGAVQTQVEYSKTPIIKAYTVKHTTYDNARDGSVTAVCENLGGNFKLMWSNGAITNGATLESVHAGQYVAIIIEVEGAPTQCVHAPEPAIVEVVDTCPRIEHTDICQRN